MGAELTTAAGFLAALVSAIALLQAHRHARREQRRRLTAVSAWATPVQGSPIEEAGVSLSVRNDTSEALQMAHVIIRPRYVRPTPTKPGEHEWGIAPIPVPLVPPKEIRAFQVSGGNFMAWRGQQPPALIVTILFQDALGDWWFKDAMGRLHRNKIPPSASGDVPELEDALRPTWSARITQRARRMRDWMVSSRRSRRPENRS